MNELPSRSMYAQLGPQEIAQQHLSWLARTKALGIIGIIVLGGVAISVGSTSGPLAVPIWLALLAGIIVASKTTRAALAGRNATLLQMVTIDLDPQKYATTICEINERTRNARARTSNLIELARAQYYMGQFQDALGILGQARACAPNQAQEACALSIEAACHHELGDFTKRDDALARAERLLPRARTFRAGRSGSERSQEDYALIFKDPASWTEQDGELIKQRASAAITPLEHDAWCCREARFELLHGSGERAREIVDKISSHELLPIQLCKVQEIKRELGIGQ